MKSFNKAVPPNSSMVDYYGQRAPEYDRIYQKPERQADLAQLRDIVRATFRAPPNSRQSRARQQASSLRTIGLHPSRPEASQTGKVLEIACGTGYWTQFLAEVATSVHAIDINESVLEIARKRPGTEKVVFQQADVYALPEVPRASACLSAFWWSHIPKGRLAQFLEQLHAKLENGAHVMFIDNRYVPGSSTPISRSDAEGNTYQARKLEDGSTHQVLKNFPSEDELRLAIASAGGRNTAIQWLEYYWVAEYGLGETNRLTPADRGTSA